MCALKFSPGEIVMTSGAVEAFRATNANPLRYLLRHLSGDWGELDPEDKRENEHRLEHGSRLLSAYQLPDGTRVWLITEADRSQTTFLLPEEY